MPPLPVEQNQIIMKDVHCPFCGENGALFISEKKSTTVSLNLPPAYGLKFLLSLIYLSIVHIFINGFKYFEFTKKTDYNRYGFCPNCGNTYPGGAPPEVVEEVTNPRFCKIRKNKAVTGLCRGISEYAGISLLWVRIVTFIYCLTVVGAFLYFLIAACVPAKEDIESGEIHELTFKAAKKGEGRVLLGLCKGFSNYTDIPTAWIRFMAIWLILLIFPVILYLVFGTVVIKDRMFRLAKKGEGKIIFGICKGYSVYADMPLWVVRTVAVIFGLTVIGTIAYIVAGLIIRKKEKKNGAV